MGEEGFVSDSSLLYHVYPPTAIVKSEGMAGAAEEGSVPNHPLMPRHVRTTDLPKGGDLVLGRQLLFANDDVQISFAARARTRTCTGTPPATRPFICNTAAPGWSPSTGRSTPWPATTW